MLLFMNKHKKKIVFLNKINLLLMKIKIFRKNQIFVNKMAKILITKKNLN